jgi:hypothetical protein
LKLREARKGQMGLIKAAIVEGQQNGSKGSSGTGEMPLDSGRCRKSVIIHSKSHIEGDLTMFGLQT